MELEQNGKSLCGNEIVGWETWTRTRIARFRVWSPTNWTISQQLKRSGLAAVTSWRGQFFHRPFTLGRQTFFDPIQTTAHGASLLPHLRYLRCDIGQRHHDSPGH